MADKKKHSIKVETSVTVPRRTGEFDLERRRAAIKAALNSAVAGLAANTSSLATAALRADDGGTPPWGEVIIGPVWEQADPPDGGARMQQIAELFWE